MSDHKVTATFKAAAGHNAPWVVINGDSPAEVRQAIADAFGLALSGQTLDKAVIEGDRWFQGQYEGAKELTTAPARRTPTNAVQEEKPAPAKKAPAKKGVAAKAKPKPAEAQVQDPTEVSDSLEAKIASAADGDALTALWKENKAEFQKDLEKYTALAKARREELNKENS